MADDLPVDEMQFGALARIGSPSAIEPLYELWQEGEDDHSLVEALLVLCEVNDVSKAELAEWRRIVQAKEARWARTLGEFESSVERGIDERAEAPEEEKPLSKSAARKPRKVSKRERKKRATQRKDGQRRKRRRQK